MDDFCKRFPDAEEHGYIPPGVTGAQPVRLRTGLTPETVRGAAALQCSSTMASLTTVCVGRMMYAASSVDNHISLSVSVARVILALWLSFSAFGQALHQVERKSTGGSTQKHLLRRHRGSHAGRLRYGGDAVKPLLVSAGPGIG